MAAYLKSLCAIYSRVFIIFGRAIIYLRFDIKVAHILSDRYLNDVLARSLCTGSEVEIIRLACEEQEELSASNT